MLLRLEGEQINSYWRIIKNSIMLPPDNNKEDAYTNILRSLLTGKMHCWLAGYDNTIKAIFTTAFLNDFDGSKSLLIYSMYSMFGYIELDLWIKGFELLKKFAKKQGCKSIVAYSNVSRILQIVRKIPGEKETIFISIPVEE